MVASKVKPTRAQKSNAELKSILGKKKTKRQASKDSAASDHDAKNDGKIQTKKATTTAGRR